jgi:hypothetical protein
MDLRLEDNKQKINRLQDFKEATSAAGSTNSASATAAASATPNPPHISPQSIARMYRVHLIPAPLNESHRTMLHDKFFKLLDRINCERVHYGFTPVNNLGVVLREIRFQCAVRLPVVPDEHWEPNIRTIILAAARAYGLARAGQEQSLQNDSKQPAFAAAAFSVPLSASAAAAVVPPSASAPALSLQEEPTDECDFTDQSAPLPAAPAPGRNKRRADFPVESRRKSHRIAGSAAAAVARLATNAAAASSNASDAAVATTTVHVSSGAAASASAQSN